MAEKGCDEKNLFSTSLIPGNRVDQRQLCIYLYIVVIYCVLLYFLLHHLKQHKARLTIRQLFLAHALLPPRLGTAGTAISREYQQNEGRIRKTCDDVLGVSCRIGSVFFYRMLFRFLQPEEKGTFIVILSLKVSYRSFVSGR